MKAMVLVVVIYWKGCNHKGGDLMPSGQVCPRAAALQTIQMAAATGKRPGLVVMLQKKGVFSPFCLFFWVCQQIQTHATMGGGQEVALVIGDSSFVKDSKSLELKATEGWDVRARILAQLCLFFLLQSEA